MKRILISIFLCLQDNGTETAAPRLQVSSYLNNCMLPLTSLTQLHHEPMSFRNSQSRTLDSLALSVSLCSGPCRLEHMCLYRWLRHRWRSCPFQVCPPSELASPPNA